MIEIGKCVVCEGPTSGSLEFCKVDYKKFQQDIKDRKPWVKVLKNEAQRERRQRKREYNIDNTSLDAIIDRSYDRERYA